MKIWEKSICLALILTVLFSFTGFSAECGDIENRVLRFHVLANSDSEHDQALKLKVRDRILAESAGMLNGIKTRTQAEKEVSARLPEIRRVAEDELRRNGSNDCVSAELTNMYFTSRQYGNVTLPAGDYDALRVVIGSGRGHNWWCVLFPALCLPAAEAPSKLSDVLNEDELRLVSAGGYDVRFKSAELYEQLINWLKMRSGR